MIGVLTIVPLQSVLLTQRTYSPCRETTFQGKLQNHRIDYVIRTQTVEERFQWKEFGNCL